MTATETEPAGAEWHARLRELAARFPVPAWADVRADWDFARAWLANPNRDPRFAGLWVAVLNGAIVGSGTDPLEVRATAAEAHAVHPERLVLTYALGERPGEW